MKLVFSKQVYDQLPHEDQATLKAVPCDCIADGKANPDCESCEGGGVVWEDELSPEISAEIQENLRRQGVPLGKIGTQ